MKRIFSILLIFSMMAGLLAGCSNGKEVSGENTGDTNITAENEGSNQTDKSGEKEPENTAMGRYVESTVDLSEFCMRSDAIKLRTDGILVVQDYYYPRIISKDNGQTWETEDVEWLDRLLKSEKYIMDLSYGSDGTAAVIYDEQDDRESNDNSAEDENDNTQEAENEEDTIESENLNETEQDSPDESKDSNESKDSMESDDSNYELNPVGLVIKPDGTEVPIQISLDENDIYMRNIWISDKGQVFVTTLGDNIYEVKEDGTMKKYLTLEDRAELVVFQDNIMIIDIGTFGDLILYDMEKEEYLEDEVLNDFVNENYKGRNSYNGGDYFDLYIFPGEEGVIYLVGEKGLYRHVIGGSTVEQVIDGSLSCLNNPSNILIGMVMLPNNEFLGLFNKKVVHFTYDPDIPTVPNEKIKVYSLEDNDTARQAITIYQTNNPEVYVEYEIGLGEDNSITRDDALKKLNTRIIAGEGPDLFILDDMPVDSYISKGLLLDLSDCLNSLGGEDAIFENIRDAFKKDDKIYVVPCEIQLPIAQGKEKYISQMKDMEGIADAFEDLRKDNPEDALVYAATEKGIMGIFSMVCAPLWKTADGELNKEAIKEFLLQSKRIYDVQMEGISDEFMERYNELNENMIAYYNEARDYPEFSRNLDWYDYLSEEIKILCGAVTSVNEYAMYRSIQKKDGYKDDVIIPLDGQNTNVFLPKNMVGINAASTNTARAEELLKVLLGKENQSYLFEGMPVNKAALEEEFIIDEKNISEDGVYNYLGASGPSGITVHLDVYVLGEKEQQDLKNIIANANTPYVTDVVLEEAVYKEGAEYIKGNKSLDEAVNAIEKSVAIYMSE